MKLNTMQLLDRLRAHGYDFFTGVPCSHFHDLFSVLAAEQKISYAPAPNEGNACAMAAGAAIVGRRAAVILQNSGLGNLINPLTSLAQVNGIPVLLLMSVRGDPDDGPDEPQHAVMGRTTRTMLEVLDVPYAECPDSQGGLDQLLHDVEQHRLADRSFAILFRRGHLCSSGRTLARANSDFSLSCADAIRVISEVVAPADLVIATTGFISRELFRHADREGNFYMQGSMGHASSVALGVALSLPPHNRVIVLDGDGATLMHMGELSTIGNVGPRNLVHIVLDNEGYGSTGDQATTSRTTLLHDVAAACRYRNATVCATAAALRDAIRWCAEAGPTFILCKTNSIYSDPLPRVTTRYTPAQNLRQVRALARASRTTPAAAALESAG